MKDRHDSDTGEVVSLKGVRQAMTYNPIAEVEAYWEALRGVRVIPLRSEIDPRGIERALDRTFLLERMAPGLARIRLAGATLSDLAGMEVRGMPLTSLIAVSSRDEMRAALEQLFDGPKALTLGLTGEGGIGRPALTGQMVLLPLRSDLGDITRALGCLMWYGRIGRVPRRFEINSTSYRDLAPFHTAQPAPAEPPAFAEPPAAFEHKPPARRDGRSARPTHLRLVKSDDE